MADLANASDLEELRAQIDEIDQHLLIAIHNRLAMCRRIAEFKRKRGIAMMQPDRITVVHASVGKFASERGLDPDFMRRVYDLIIEEACRIECRVMDGSPGDDCRTALARTARRIDHVAIAVKDLEAAIYTFCDRYGFKLTERRQVQGNISGMQSATLQAGGVTVVLCQGDTPKSNVSMYIEHYGPGVQHLAIEVEDQHLVLDDLRERGADLLTDIIHAPDLDQSFTKRDPNTGMQIEFVTRSARTGFDDSNVQELFTAMERENVF